MPRERLTGTDSEIDAYKTPCNRGLNLSRIEGVFVCKVNEVEDHRGWLCETYRSDSIFPLFGYKPVQTYVSMTNPGIQRGPHEHRDQTDFFTFVNPVNLELWLWDNRTQFPVETREVFRLDDKGIYVAMIPPGVVHGYWNRSKVPVLILNAPNQLYKGPNKSGYVDEIRWELNPKSPFLMRDDPERHENVNKQKP